MHQTMIKSSKIGSNELRIDISKNNHFSRCDYPINNSNCVEFSNPNAIFFPSENIFDCLVFAIRIVFNRIVDHCMQFLLLARGIVV